MYWIKKKILFTDFLRNQIYSEKGASDVIIWQVRVTKIKNETPERDLLILIFNILGEQNAKNTT